MVRSVKRLSARFKWVIEIIRSRWRVGLELLSSKKYSQIDKPASSVRLFDARLSFFISSLDSLRALNKYRAALSVK
jgi:hypothetical protein